MSVERSKRDGVEAAEGRPSACPPSAGSAPRGAVFLSYASQDAEAARRICEALRAAGIEVWFDQSELRGGDAWDAKIRKQIKECALFVPIISANTQARAEGYFRLEWLLAVERSRLMADHVPFLLPVVIDDTSDAAAFVPEKFREVQWTRLRPAGYGGQARFVSDESLAAFCERVRTLLSGQVETRPSSAASRAERASTAALPTDMRRRWRVPAITGLVAVGSLALWQPWKKAAAPPEVTTAQVDTKAETPLTEAQKLTRQACALIDEDRLAGRESFRLAEELCQRATALDPTNGDVWAISARVSLEMMDRNYDRTDKRLQSARSQTERAQRLAPGSTEANLATAALLMRTGSAKEAEARYRALLEIAPQNARVALGLARALSAQNRTAEASEIRLRHPAFGGRDARPLIDEAEALRNTQLGESDALLERAQAIAPSLAGYFYHFANVVNLWGDLEQGRALLEQLPVRILQEDSIAGTAAWLWIRLGDGNKALQVLERVPRDYLEEFRQEWPKGFLTGWANQVAGRSAAAQSEWKRALSVVETRLAADSDKPRLIQFKALLQALTGKNEEAEKTYRLFREQRRYRDHWRFVWDAEFQLALGRPDEAIADLQRTSRLQAWEITLVRHDPSFAPIRNDPRVAAIIAEDVARIESMRRRPAAPSAVPEKSIAVLPFANLSDDKDSTFFADGVHEDILTSLYLIPDLRVTSRTSVMQYRGTTKTARVIGEELGVAYVLEGSVRRAADTVRVTSQLINTRTDHHLWAKRYDKKLTEVFAIQSELAQAIAAELEAKLSPQQKQLLEQRPTENATAYDLFLRARELSRASATEESGRGGRFDPNIEVFLEAALRLDPRFAAAWGRLSEFHAFRFEQDGDRGGRNDEALAKARRALEAVVRLDPDSPTALRTRGQFCYAVDRNFACAEENYARVATLLPNDPEIAFKLGWTRWNLSRWSEAVDALRKAVRLDPDVAHMTRDLADWLEQGRRYRDAQPVRQRLARLQPVDEPRHSFRAAMCFFLASGSPVEVEAFFAGLTEAQANSAAGIGVRRQWAIATGNRTEFLRLERTPGGGGVNKALMLLAHGDAPAAREVLEGRSAALKSSAEQTPNRHGILAELAEVEALLGRREEALAWVGKLRELRPWNVPAAGPVRAFVHAWTGDKERAIAEYARLLQTVGGPNVHVMRRDPRYAPLQGDPRFEALLNDPKNSAPLF